jgi:hypothetical protein
MEHSNPQLIDHSKDSTFEAFTGSTEDFDDFMSEIVTNINDYRKVSDDPHSGSLSFFLEQLMKYPNLSDEAKIVVAIEYGQAKGIMAGQEMICNHCAIGPASKLMHSFLKGKGNYEEEGP